MARKQSFVDILQRVKHKNMPIKDDRYKNYHLNFNPFPKSGTANIKAPSEQLKVLPPVSDDLRQQIEEYIVSTLFAESYNAEDKYMGATIIGNYGSGKTQMLMYVKYLLELVAIDKDYHQNPYVVYIDNPGVKLSELIGKIISEIGEENFKKFLWSKTIDRIEVEYKVQLDNSFPINAGLFGLKADPWEEGNKVNYKKFLDAWLVNLTTKQKQKDFEESIKEYIVQILGAYTNDNIVAQYLYKVLVEELVLHSVWDSIVKGDIKGLIGKESNIIKFIVDLLYVEGYTHVYVLVDEFEDITRGRLSKAQVDNYLYSLRTLIDKERNWTIVFAMTQEAFMSLEQASPPLADRITSRKIYIPQLSVDETLRVVYNYLQFARTADDKGPYFPFTEEAVKVLNRKLLGNSRMILSSCFKLIELGVNANLDIIPEEIVEKEIEAVAP